MNVNAPHVTVETDDAGFWEYDREKLDARNEFDLHTLSTGEAQSIRFDTPGRYQYHSSYDFSMKGSVIVIPAAPLENTQYEGGRDAHDSAGGQ